MASCLSGGGRAYKLEVEIMKSPSTSWASRSSSPSPTFSESSNSSVAISTRKPRTPRKRPNQTYHEAAALLSTAYPTIFSATPCKFTPPNHNPPFSTTADLLLPFSVLDGSCDTFLLHSPVERILNQHPAVHFKLLSSCGSPEEMDSSNSSSRLLGFDDFEDDFDAESILDKENEEGGIDSIMGKLSGGNDSTREWMSASYGFPIGIMGFEAIKNVDNNNNGDYWWRFPSVNVVDITPKPDKSPPSPENNNKKKKKKKVEKPAAEFRIDDKERSSSSAASKQDSSGNPNPKSSLLLKLNYDTVLTEWMDRPSPFSDESPCSEATGTTDVQARLAQIDLFSESGVREASVLRYKEKRRTRLFSKKIRYQVRKVNSDRRPRMKGRFVKSPNSPDDSEQG